MQIRFLILLFTFFGSLQIGPRALGQAELAKQSSLLMQLERIKIPKLEFKDEALHVVLGFIEKRVKAAGVECEIMVDTRAFIPPPRPRDPFAGGVDPFGEQFDFFGNVSEAEKGAEISVWLEGASALECLEFVCYVSGLSCHVGERVVLISNPKPSLQVRIYPAFPELMNRIKAQETIEDYLIWNGIWQMTYPHDDEKLRSSATYSHKSDTITLVDSPENLRAFELHLSSLLLPRRPPKKGLARIELGLKDGSILQGASTNKISITTQIGEVTIDLAKLSSFWSRASGEGIFTLRNGDRLTGHLKGPVPLHSTLGLFEVQPKDIIKISVLHENITFRTLSKHVELELKKRFFEEDEKAPRKGKAAD